MPINDIYKGVINIGCDARLRFILSILHNLVLIIKMPLLLGFPSPGLLPFKLSSWLFDTKLI